MESIANRYEWAKYEANYIYEDRKLVLRSNAKIPVTTGNRFTHRCNGINLELNSENASFLRSRNVSYFKDKRMSEIDVVR